MEKLIYVLILTLFKIGYFGIPVGIILVFCSLEEPENKTLGIIGCGIGFGGAALALIIGKVTEKIEDHFGSLYEPEPEFDTMLEENKPMLNDEDLVDQTVNPETKKIYTKIGWIISIAIVIVMFGGILLMYGGSIFSDNVFNLFAAGSVMVFSPVLILGVMALLPEKMRGVKKKPRRERALEILIIVSIIMTFGGFSSMIVTALIPGRKGLSAAVICAVVGAFAAMKLMPVYRRMTGKNTLRIEVFPSDEEFEKSAYNTLN